MKERSRRTASKRRECDGSREISRYQRLWRTMLLRKAADAVHNGKIPADDGFELPGGGGRGVGSVRASRRYRGDQRRYHGKNITIRSYIGSYSRGECLISGTKSCATFEQSPHIQQAPWMRGQRPMTQRYVLQDKYDNTINNTETSMAPNSQGTHGFVTRQNIRHLAMSYSFRISNRQHACVYDRALMRIVQVNARYSDDEERLPSYLMASRE